MIPKELAKKIRYIQIYTSKTVNNVLAGEYESVFKGQGIEFEEVREYQPGDEVRNIHWNITAKMGRPYVKRYVEERELTVYFIVDLSASGSFGSISKTKNEIAAEICALLAFSAIKNNDKVGLIIFTNDIELFIPPKKGLKHALRIIRELLYFEPKRVQTDINKALEFFAKINKKRCVAFLVSDFQETNFEKIARILNKKHDLIAITINDPRELYMPDVGIIELEDAETGEIIIIDTTDKEFRKNYEKINKEYSQKLTRLFNSIGVDQILIQTNEDYVKKLIQFFVKREKKSNY